MNHRARLAGKRAPLVVTATLACLLLGLVSANVALAQRSKSTPAKPKPAMSAPAKPAAAPKVKGIFEPVNFKEDLRLESVCFLTPELGYASGEAGTIIRTTDGGESWTVQLGGDPQTQLPPVHSLRFIDETHGWAIMGDKKLLRTTDGENWQEYGRSGEGWGCKDYIFTSPTTAVQLLGSDDGNRITYTKDGGLTYQQVNPSCQVGLEINGLRRNVSCRLSTMHFVSPEVGYAVGATESGNGDASLSAIVILKTTDGGGSWVAHAVVENVAKAYESWYYPQQIFFTDENNGVLVLPWSEKFLVTSDGGRTWEGRFFAVRGPFKFADPEVGWSFNIHHGGKDLSFTTNGGKLWTTRPIKFAAEVKAFSLPRRDRGYVVGDHGMVYRYRTVPINYEAPHILDAPLMPGFDSSLDEEAETLATEVAALEDAVESDAGSGGATATDANDDAEESEDADEMTAEADAGSDSKDGGSAEGESDDANEEDGDAAVASGAASDAKGATWSPQRYGTRLQKIQATLASVSAGIPKFQGKLRNLNLIFFGLQILDELTDQGSSAQTALASFRSARDSESARAALAELSQAAQALAATARAAFRGNALKP